MQLPFADGRGCNAERGTLRFIPGYEPTLDFTKKPTLPLASFAGQSYHITHRSHGWDRQQHAAFEAELASRREAQGIPANGHEQVDAEMPGEVTVEVGPNDIILRESTIYHASHANSTTEGRLMQHWCASALRFCFCVQSSVDDCARNCWQAVPCGRPLAQQPPNALGRMSLLGSQGTPPPHSASCAVARA